MPIVSDNDEDSRISDIDDDVIVDVTDIFPVQATRIECSDSIAPTDPSVVGLSNEFLDCEPEG